MSLKLQLRRIGFLLPFLTLGAVSDRTFGGITLSRVATLSVSNGIRDIVAVGSYVYTANASPGVSGLGIIDVSVPSKPAAVTYTDGKSDSFRVTGSGGNLYVLYSDQLSILSLSNPTNPAPIGYVRGSWNEVAISGSYAYLTAATGAVRIYDVSDPSQPASLGSITADSSTKVGPWDNFAFLTSGGLLVSDVTNPRAPVTYGPFSGYFNGLAAAEGYLYTLSYTDSFRIFDISTATNPVETYASGWQPDAERLAVSGNYAFLLYGFVDGISIYDVSPVTNAPLAGSIDPHPYSATALTVSGNYMYVGCYHALLVYCLGAPSPALSITANDSEPILSWPAPTIGFVVQESSDPKTGLWTSVTNLPLLIGTNNQVLIPAPSSNRFYRLIAK